MSSKRLLKSIAPPFLWNIGKDFKRRLLPSVDHYAYAPQGWDTPLPAGDDNQAYWSTFIARERVLCQALIARIRAGDPVLTEDGDIVKYVMFGYVLALAARHKDRLTMIDYGGNLGEYSWIGKALLTEVELEYHCKELPAVAAAGRLLAPDVIWHTDDACLQGPYDLVMFSASLPYLPDWKEILRRAATGTRDYLFLSDIPTVREVPAFIITQRTSGVTNRLCVMNRSEIVDTVQRAGLRLVREFAMGSHPPVANAPAQPVSVGWLFAR